MSYVFCKFTEKIIYQITTWPNVNFFLIILWILHVEKCIRLLYQPCFSLVFVSSLPSMLLASFACTVFHCSSVGEWSLNMFESVEGTSHQCDFLNTVRLFIARAWPDNRSTPSCRYSFIFVQLELSLVVCLAPPCLFVVIWDCACAVMGKWDLSDMQRYEKLQ